MIPRRWPYVTTAMIGLCLVLFLAFHAQLAFETDQYAQIESRTVRLSAAHPTMPAMTASQQALIETSRRRSERDGESLSAGESVPSDAWENEQRKWDSNRTEQEMKALGQALDSFERRSLVANYGVYPPRLAPVSYLTATFLDLSWGHLLFALVFLWLAGSLLEDEWGWQICLPFYLLAGAASVWAYIIVYPATMIPPIGASGLSTAVVGAFVVRFPKTHMRRGTALWSVRPRLMRFSSPVYVVLPVWLLAEVCWGVFGGEGGDLAYLAKGGALSFGIVVALLMKLTGADRHVEQAIDARVGWSADPHIVRAGAFLEKGLLDSAIAEIGAQLTEKPASAEAHEMMVSLCLRKKDIPAYLRALEARCALRIQMSEPEGAWQDYQDYRAAGGSKMPADTWLELCRIAEGQEIWERAAGEYRELAESWPNERASVVALVAAGRLHLQNGQPQEGQRFYLAARDSTVPHADWDDTIRKGLEKSAAAMGEKSSAPIPWGGSSKK